MDRFSRWFCLCASRSTTTANHPRVIHTSSRLFRATMTTNGVSALHPGQIERTARAFATAAPNNTTNGHTKVNAWSAPGPAAFDFRSDVVTTPTTSMLNAIASTTLLDDVYMEDPCTTGLEALVADLTGFEAAVLVTSGTQGNQVALRTALQAPPHSLLCDSRSHIMVYEAGGVASLCGALVHPLKPANGHHLTLRDIKRAAVLSDDVHACPTRLISLENTLNGTILPLADARAISTWARAQSPAIHMHLDGARLWEAVAAGAGSLRDYSACFDSISLCFSKGLGAPIGSIVVGSNAFIKRARWIRKSIGGGLRQAGVIAAPARVAVEETFLGGHLTATHALAKRVEGIWAGMGGALTHPVETNMVWLDVDAVVRAKAGTAQDEDADDVSGVDAFVAAAAAEGLRTAGGRLVIHYQVNDEAVQRLERAMRRFLADHGNGWVEAVGEHEVQKIKADAELKK